MLLIDKYLLSKKISKRRTRGGTKKLIENHQIEILKTTKNEIQCKFGNSIMKVEIQESTREVLNVTCTSDCHNVDFCDHREILLLYLNKIGNFEPLKRRMSIESSPERNVKKQKFNDENNSTVANANVQIAEIKISKKKKKIVLSEKQKVQHEHVRNTISMENLVRSFGRGSYKDFYNHCKKIMSENEETIKLANNLTVEQADTDLWHNLRIGRVTASRLHETTRCTVKNGSLVDKYLGKSSGFSFMMYRGTVLEEFVFEEIKKEYPTIRRCGLIMNHEKHPLFAASPDGIHEEFVLEIKCPGTANTFQNYIHLEKLNKKYFAQIQMQMHITNKSKALLAVASLDFETTRNITKLWITYDECYVKEMIEYASDFYENAIFPALKRKFLN